MADAKHTPGPWRWEVNRAHKSVELAGGSPKFDKSVMSFRRYGMNGAAPAFWFWEDGRNWSEPPKRAHELAKPVAGREHHSNWFANVDHPDARLIAAAPDLLAAAKLGLRMIALLTPSIAEDADQLLRDAVEKIASRADEARDVIRAAIVKAECAQ